MKMETLKKANTLQRRIDKLEERKRVIKRMFNALMKQKDNKITLIIKEFNNYPFSNYNVESEVKFSDKLFKSLLDNELNEIDIRLIKTKNELNEL